MKSFSFFKKTISSFLVVTILLVSIFSAHTPKAEAQLFGGGGNASGGLNIQGIAGVALTCSTKFFAERKAAKAAAALSEKGEAAVVDGVGELSEAVIGTDITDAASGVTPGPKVPVVDETVKASVQAEVGKVNTETTLQSFKEECLDLIARFIVLKIIDKITFMTVEWINSGFEGNPFYPEDRANFFEEIAKDEIVSFTGWFSMNPEDYPFGRILSETILLTVQNRLQDNMRFSLNQVLQSNNQYASYENFQARFSVGGWAGYTAFAQPNNNIFGNYIMANNHLSRQIAGSDINIVENFQQELNEAGGLLNQRVCRLTNTGDPADVYFDRNDPMHMGGYSLMGPNGTVSDVIELLPEAVQAELSDVEGDYAQREMYNYFVNRSNCAKWETVTPGRFIAEQTSQALGSPLRGLELADEFNENLGLILDTLAAQLFEQGLRAFQRPDGQYSSNPNDPNYNALWAQSNDPDFGANANQPPVSEVLNGEGLDSGLLEIQQSYLIQANSAIQNISTLIRDIRALDYCVPGPNPRWNEFASINLQSMINEVAPSGDGVYYAAVVEDLTGIIIPEYIVPDYTQFSLFMNFVFTKYRNEVLANYSSLQAPPTIRPVASNYFSQIEGYQTQIGILQNQVNNLIPVIPQIQAIFSQYESLTPEQQGDPNSPEMQVIESLLDNIYNQNAIVSQGQLDQVTSNVSNYASQIFAVNGYINDCLSEVSTGYTALNERIQYPFQSIYENTIIGNNLPVNADRFLNNINFGDDNTEINISGFNDFTFTVPTVTTEIFANNLQSLY